MWLNSIIRCNRQGKKWADLGLTILVLVYSGNPAPVRAFPAEPQLVALGLLLGVLLLMRSRPSVFINYLSVAAVFAGIMAVQCIQLAFYPYFTMAGFFVRLFIGFALVHLVDDPPRVFVRAMIGVAVVSLVFHIPYVLLSAIGVSFEDLINRMVQVLGTTVPRMNRRPVFLHTFWGTFSPRNCGMFWEPGAFQGYLVLALVFLSIIKSRIPRRQYIRQATILVVTVLTTLSTTGYLAIPLVLPLFYTWKGSDPRQTAYRILAGAYLVLAPLTIGAYISYLELPFLKDKIDQQRLILERRQGRWHRGRMGSLAFDWEYIHRRPLTGWGPHPKTRFALNPHMEDSEGMGNGFSDFVAKYGIIGFGTWLTATGIGFRRLTQYSLWRTALILGIIMVELQGECFLGTPFWLGLAFLWAAPTAPA